MPCSFGKPSGKCDHADGRDWDLEFEKSPACSLSVEASNTAKAGAVFLKQNQFYAATGAEIPGTNITSDKHVGMLVSGTRICHGVTAVLHSLPHHDVTIKPGLPFWRQLTVAILAKT